MTTFLNTLIKWKRLFTLLFFWMPLFVTQLLLSMFIPFLKRKYDSILHSVMDVTTLKPEDYVNSIYSIGFITQCFRSMYLDISKEAFLGKTAPNPKLVSLNGKTECSLLDFQKKGRALVLNFGSCTWPPYVAKLAGFNEIIAEFGDKADFLAIYIEEAHASDGWKFENNFDINKHRSLQDRLAAAKMLRDLDPHCLVMVDRMDNEANKLYGALYERLYIILDSVVVYEGKRGPMGYKIEEVHEWLNNYFRS